MEISLLSIIIMVGDEMTHRLYKNNNSFIAPVATIFILAIVIVASSMTGNAVATATTMQQPPITATTEEEATNNNNSGSILGSLFMIHEGERTSFNPVNDTYTEISVVSNTTIIPPNTTDVVINATERGNLTLNIQPNSVTLAQGQVFLVTQDDDGEAVQEENATATIVEINRIMPDGIGSGTGVAFYKTNSTGQLAFLDNMLGISQREINPEGYTIKIWEWKEDGTLPFDNGNGSGAGTATAGNQTTTGGTLLEE